MKTRVIRKVPKPGQKRDKGDFAGELEMMRRIADEWINPDNGKKMNKRQRQNFMMTGQLPNGQAIL